MLDLIVKNGVIVTHEERFPGNLLIHEGKIAAISTSHYLPEAMDIIDLHGKYIIPGAIDAHVHFQDPGLTHREDFESATAAAAAGGITTAISHPMNIPPIVDVDSYRFTMRAYQGRGCIDYAIHGGGTSDNLQQIDALWQETGATSIKMFMCFSVADFPFVRDDALFAILKKLAIQDGLAILHAENNELIALEEKRLQAEGRNDPMAYNLSHSAAGELEAVKRALYYLEITGAQGLILHSGMAEALREIRKAQERGVRVYAECCPHYLTFVDTDMLEYGPYLKFSPVMRDEANRQELWKLLNQGYIQTIGSDHSPYTSEEKVKGMQDIWQAPNGIPGIQTMLPVLLDGVSRGLLSMERLVEVTSYNPARIYGLAYRKGSITVGKDADLVVVDMELKKPFTKDEIYSKAKWSPYVGREFQGWPVLTIVRGKIVAKDGKVITSSGWGRYIERPKS